MILYPYAFYPSLLWFISLFKKQPRKRQFLTISEWPSVTMLISAYNEEAVIEEKILNSLSLDYPKDLLEVIVISDGSTDRTDALVKKYEDKQIKLLRFEGRQGKTGCLNGAVRQAQGSILVFSDANSLYDKNAVKNLAVRFENSRVGFVTGFTRYRLRVGDGISEGISLYSRLEKFIKSKESIFGSCVGADGAIFGIRKNLYMSLRNEDINDFVIPISIIRQGFHGVLEEAAFCSESAVGGSKSEFKRQVRITARTLRALLNNRDLLNPLKYPFFTFALFSHKVAKLLVPFFLLLLSVNALILLSKQGTYMLSAVCLALSIMMLAHQRKQAIFSSKLGSLIYSFTSINAAVFIGWLNFLKRKTYTVWMPTQR